MDLESKIAWQVVEERCNAVPLDHPKLRGRARRLRWKRGESRRHRCRLQEFSSETNHVLPFPRAAQLVAEAQQADSPARISFLPRLLGMAKRAARVRVLQVGFSRSTRRACRDSVRFNSTNLRMHIDLVQAL
jgi:hypothetical protein